MMDSESALTDRQRRVLTYIIECQKNRGISPTVREICAHFKLRSPGGIHRILNVLKDKGVIDSDSGKKRSWRFAGPLPGSSIPLLGDIAAGNPIDAVPFMGEKLEVSPSLFGAHNCFGLRVSGDSMIEAHIMDGDIAIIRPQQQVENGEIAAVMIREGLPEATLKIIRRSRHALVLEAANTAYEDMVFKGSQRALVTILGKYIGIIRKHG